MRRKEGTAVGRRIYICISRDPLITASSVFRRLSFRLSPLHPLDRAVCWVALPAPPPTLSLFLSFSLFLQPLPSLQPSYLPLRRAPLRLIDFLRPDGVRGCDSNGCSFSRLSSLAPVRPQPPSWSHYHTTSPPITDSHLEFSSLLFREETTTRTMTTKNEDEDEASGRIDGWATETKEEQEWRETVAERKGLGGWRRRTYPEGRECKILQPRGTHGDVISTTKLETYYNPTVLQPRSHSVPMYEWPILLGLSLGKTLSIPITAPRPSASPPAPRAPADSRISPEFYLILSPTSLHGRIRGTKISFVTGAGRTKT